MSSRFNIVNKPKKIETEEDETEEKEDELQEEKEAKKKDENAKKKMMKFMTIIVGVFILLLVILFLCSIFIKKSFTYSEIETIMKEAAISYFEDNKSALPAEDGDVVEIDVANLVAAEKMKPLSEYTGENTSCSGSVQVEKSGTEYLYTPFLNCGDTYTTIELHNHIVNEETIKTTGYGLYSMDGSYVYRGENVNNYVQLENALWRIVKITPNNNIVLIKAESAGDFLPWDNRYNKDANYAAGINTYSASRIKDSLDELYKGTTEEAKQKTNLLSNSDKAKIVSYDLCVGKRGTTEVSKNNAVECKETLKDQKVGLLTLSDYMNASVDANCVNPSSLSCQNYNYLVAEFNWWTVTASSGSTYEAYQIGEDGNIEITRTGNYSNLRPVIYLNSKALYQEGNGTIETPYIVK